MNQRTADIYNFIADFIEREGYSPSPHEIGAGIGICVGTATAHLQILEGRGLITRQPPRSYWHNIRLNSFTPSHIPALPECDNSQKEQPVNEKAARIINYISHFIATEGYSPSLREIADGARISSISLVSYHLAALEGQGLITRQPRRVRRIRTTVKLQRLYLYHSMRRWLPHGLARFLAEHCPCRWLPHSGQLQEAQRSRT